jgi:MFS family permease
MVSRLGEARMMILGSALVAAALGVIGLNLSWPLQFVAFLALGFGFFTLHGCIQLYATELAPTARASAMAFHSASLFFGQAIGPIYYGFGIAHGELGPSIVVGTVAILAVGFVCARLLPKPA